MTTLGNFSHIMDGAESPLTMYNIGDENGEGQLRDSMSVDLEANKLMDDEAFQAMLDNMPGGDEPANQAFATTGAQEMKEVTGVSMAAATLAGPVGLSNVHAMLGAMGGISSSTERHDGSQIDDEDKDKNQSTNADVTDRQQRADTPQSHFNSEEQDRSQDPSTPANQFKTSASSFVGVFIPPSAKKSLGGALYPKAVEIYEKSLMENEKENASSLAYNAGTTTENGEEHDQLDPQATAEPLKRKSRRPFEGESSPEPEPDIEPTQNAGRLIHAAEANIANNSVPDVNKPTEAVDDDDLYREPTPIPSSSRRSSASVLVTAETSQGREQDPHPLSLKDTANVETVEQAMEVDDETDEEEDEIGRRDFEYPQVAEMFGKPVLELEQLVAWVIAISAHRSLTLTEIINRIKQISSYYSDQDTQGDSMAHPWTKNVKDILHRYDFPTVPTLCNEDGELYFTLPDGGEWFVLNKPKKIKIYIPETGKKRSLLFQMPDNIKHKIYGFVLTMPLPKRWGWKPDEKYTLNRVNIYDSKPQTSQYLTTIVPGTNWELRSRPMQELLALARVHPQVRDAALPIFYRTNTFYFPYPKIMGRFLLGIGPTRRNWVRNIVLNWKTSLNAHECRRSMCQLLQTKLRNLHLIVDEQKLLITHIQVDIMQLPGVKFLGEMSGLEKVTFQGDYKMIKRLLADAEVTETKKAKDKDFDTDEEIEASVEQADKVKRKEFMKFWRASRREDAKEATRRKHAAHRREVKRRREEAVRRKKERAEQLEEEKERKRREKARRSREREQELEEEEEEKEQRREELRRARKRKRLAEENDKAERKEAREAARAERCEQNAAERSEKAERKEAREAARRERNRQDAADRNERQRQAQAKIRDQRERVKSLLGQKKGKAAPNARAKAKARGRRTEMYSALHDPSNSEETDNETSDSDSDSDSESDADYDRPTRKTTGGKSVAGKRPAQSRKRPAKQTYEDEFDVTAEEDNVDDMDDFAPPAKKPRHSYHGGSIKGVADALKRSSGQGGAPKGPKIGMAQKLAATKRTMNQNLERKLPKPSAGDQVEGR